MRHPAPHGTAAAAPKRGMVVATRVPIAGVVPAPRGCCARHARKHALPALRLRAACLATLRYLPWEWGLHAHAEAWSDFLVRAWAACLGGDRALPCPTGRCLSRERGQFSAPLPAACSARARILGREPELGLCKKSTPKQFGCSSHTRCHFPREWRLPAREVALIFEKKIRRFSYSLNP